ncbi:hypothetical protein HGI15_00475 [Modestobacter lapidis]|nr:hypothetical protein [Modestobacter lapidis]
MAGQEARRISAEGRPRRFGWADGVAARARYPKGTGTGGAPAAARDNAEEARPGLLRCRWPRGGSPEGCPPGLTHRPPDRSSASHGLPVTDETTRS